MQGIGILHKVCIFLEDSLGTQPRHQLYLHLSTDNHRLCIPEPEVQIIPSHLVKHTEKVLVYKYVIAEV